MFFKSGQPDPKRPKLVVDSAGYDDHGECSSSVSAICNDQGDNGGTASEAPADRGNGG